MEPFYENIVWFFLDSTNYAMNFEYRNKFYRNVKQLIKRVVDTFNLGVPERHILYSK